MITNMAVIVPNTSGSSSSEQAAVGQSACRYSVKIDSYTYKCYTDEEYNREQAQEAEKGAKARSEFGDFIKKWWWVGAIIFSAFVLWVLGTPQEEW